MIGDGMGYNCVGAYGFYYGPASFTEFPVKLAVATFPAIKTDSLGKTGPRLNPGPGYVPALAWSDSSYLRKNVTESSAAATALATGFKTYNSSVGLGPAGDTLLNLTEYAKTLGKSAGIITSVPFSHATPAGFSVHNRSRENYREIALSMLFGTRLDVLMGCGNPEYDENGKLLETKWKSSKYVADSMLWLSLKSGSGIQASFIVGDRIYRVMDCSGDRIPDPWTLVSTADDFRKLMKGKTPKRLLGIPSVYSTLQEGRAKGAKETKETPPLTCKPNPGIPTLAQMAAAGLNVLDNNKKGFFVMIEGGAVDWANHDNHKGRMLEEMKGFVNAVDTVMKWITDHSGWDETLLIVVADHETGDLWGGPTYTPIKDNGIGIMPGLKYNTTGHTNALVGLWAKGRGADQLSNMIKEKDPVRGSFIQNTDIPRLIFRLWGREITF
jgi:alkaline phosphatase